MRSKRKSLAILLLTLLVLIVILLLDPGYRQWLPAFVQQHDHKTIVAETPLNTALPASTPAYRPLAELPASVKKQALAVSLVMKGRVTNKRGDGVPAARVELSVQEELLLEPRAVAQMITDVLGYYQLETEPIAALAYLTAEKEGYSPGRVGLDLQGEIGLVRKDLTLMDAVATLSGNVSDSQGQPIPSATVLFSSEAAPERQYTTTFRLGSSGKSGEYLLTNLPAGLGILSVRAPGYALNFRRIELETGDNTADIELEGKPTFYIAVKNRRGEPVKYSRAFATTGKRSRLIGFGDESGVIDVLLRPEINSFEWEVRAVGYRPAAVAGNPKGGRADVTLEDGPVISGVVVSTGGHPVPRASVLAGCRSPGGLTRTDAAGRFSMNIACNSDFFLDVSCPGYISRSLRLTAQAAKQDVVIKLREPEGGISGLVLHADGRPVTRFQLQIEKEGDADEPFSITRGICDPDGRFAVLDLPAGQLNIEISPADSPDGGGPSIEPETFRLEIRKGMVYSDLVIRLKN